MQTAIDRLIFGKEEEVNIINFDGYRRHNRFICPECGEYVNPHFGNKNKFFSHPKGKGLDCDKRVDGKSCTYYERVGLSMYLKKVFDTFELQLALPPLPDNLINLASSKKAKVIISASSHFSQTTTFV